MNSPESKGGTALSFAAAQGHIMIVDLLLARGDVDVNRPKANGTTALFSACLRGQVRLLTMWVDFDLVIPILPIYLSAPRSAQAEFGRQWNEE